MTPLALPDSIAPGHDDILVGSVWENAITVYNGRAFECRVGVFREDETSYSAFAMDLPGAVSYGATVEEAVANIHDALGATLSKYLLDGQIPWQANGAYVPRDAPKVAEKRIIVDA